MSHHKLKVGASAPSANGDFDISLTDLSDVSGTPSDGQVLGYSSGAWGGSAGPANAQIPFLSWRLLSGSFSTGTYTYDAGDTVIWRNAQFNIVDATYVSRTTSSGSLVPVTTSSWSMYFTLRASGLEGKTVKCLASHQARSVTGTDEVVYQWAVSSGGFSSYTPIGPKARQTTHYVTPCFGYYTVGASDINVALVITAQTGVVNLINSSNANLSYMYMTVVGD